MYHRTQDYINLAKIYENQYQHFSAFASTTLPTSAIIPHISSNYPPTHLHKTSTRPPRSTNHGPPPLQAQAKMSSPRNGRMRQMVRPQALHHVLRPQGHRVCSPFVRTLNPKYAYPPPSAGQQTFSHSIDFTFEGKLYTINEADCTSNAGVWSTDNGGECTLNVTPELCASAHGSWYTENGGGCTVDPADAHVMGSFVDILTAPAPSSNVTARHVTMRSLDVEEAVQGEMKSYGDGDGAAMNGMLGAVLGLATGIILVLLAKSVMAAWGRREDARRTRCVLVGGDIEGGYRDVKDTPEQEWMQMQ
jgi:hypothetical protein